MKILVADDIASNRQILKWMLEEEGYSVVEAVNGLEAIETFNNEAPDLVLMDVMMPVMDGIEATSRIKRDAEAVHTPIIFLTALTDDESLSKCLAAGGDDFLSKPVNETVLTAKLRAHRRVKELNTLIHKKNTELNALHEQILHEQDIAKAVFDNALSRCFFDCDHLRYYISPATTFNGDLLLVARSASGGVYILLADFTGHGLPAALGALPLSQTFFTCSEKGLSVADLAFELNRSLERFLPDHMFAAASLLELNRTGTRVILWSGGMPPSLITDAKGALKTSIPAPHMSLGVLSDHEFDRSVKVVDVEEGDRLYLYTDGITEAMNPQGDLYGQERLLGHFLGTEPTPFQRIIEDVKAFSVKPEQSDDITLVELICRITDCTNPAKTVLAESALSSWTVEIPFNTNDLRKDNLVEPIIGMIGASPVFNGHKDYLTTILSELLSNALEHGVLALSSELKSTEEGFVEYYQQRAGRLAALASASIHVKLAFEVDEDREILHISVKDSGKGFDTKRSVQADDNSNFGRGRALLERLCESVSYSEQGTRVDVRYRLL